MINTLDNNIIENYGLYIMIHNLFYPLILFNTLHLLLNFNKHISSPIIKLEHGLVPLVFIFIGMSSMGIGMYYVFAQPDNILIIHIMYTVLFGVFICFMYKEYKYWEKAFNYKIYEFLKNKLKKHNYIYDIDLKILYFNTMYEKEQSFIDKLFSNKIFLFVLIVIIAPVINAIAGGLAAVGILVVSLLLAISMPKEIIKLYFLKEALEKIQKEENVTIVNGKWYDDDEDEEFVSRELVPFDWLAGKR